MPPFIRLFLALIAVPILDSLAETNSVADPDAGDPGCLVWPSPTNAVQLRLATNAVSGEPVSFNTIAIRGWGQTLLAALGLGVDRITGHEATALHRLDQVLIDGGGPTGSTNANARVLETASGPDWRYVALDLTAAYRDRLKRYRRDILFVEPDLFVLRDQVEADMPVRYQMILHPPAATVLDPDWGDLRLATDRGGLWIHAPSTRRELRRWERLVPEGQAEWPGTVTMGLGPTNAVTHLQVLVAFGVTPPGERPDYAFKLLESPTAIGARIHRHGLPTLVAFRTSDDAAGASLTGFVFPGPVGVDVFRPRRRPTAVPSASVTR